MDSSNSYRKIFAWIVVGAAVLVAAFFVTQKIRSAAEKESQMEQAAAQKVVAGETNKRTAAGEAVIEISAERLRQLPIRVDRAVLQPFVARVTLTGEIAARPNAIVDVESPVSGRLLADPRAHQVTIGDAVQRGQILAIVENLEAGLQGVATEAHVREGRHRVDQAKIDLDRAEQLYKIKAVALKEVQQAKLNLQVAENDLQSFQKQNQLYGSARWTEKDSAGPGRFFIRAPLSGVVTASNYRPGESVAGNQAMATIADVSTVAVLGNVFYETLSSIHAGARAMVRVSAYPNRTYPARLRTVADTVDSTTKTVRVLFEAANPQRQLKIGMPAEIEIETAAKVEGILTPAACVISEEGVSAIYVRVAPNQFVRRAVTVGARVGDRVEIKTGLKAGEEFIAQGPMSIKAESQRGSLATGENEEKEAKKE